MGKITFILGGARSGKSSFAVKLAKKQKGKAAFIPTCQPFDAEMKKRIALHKKTRPANWVTLENSGDMNLLLKQIDPKIKVVIIDCLTLLVSNLMFKKLSEKEITTRIKEILKTITKAKYKTIIVSNEVGLGIVPVNKLAREFRDIAGRINQLTASEADEVFFLVSGLNWRIK